MRLLCRECWRGGFELRSWNTNNSELKERLVTDSTLTEQVGSCEKVLGYVYDCNSDLMSLSDFELDIGAFSKRSILSNISKIFDPISVYSPVTVRGRLLMKLLWESKIGWDEEIPLSCRISYQNLCHDLYKLKSISFPRWSLDSTTTSSLFIFCDASKQVYGFSAYAVTGGTSNLIFSKSKMAPCKSRSLPTLELLSVVLALKCLPTIVDSKFDVKFDSITITVDAQVVLAWITSADPKPKNMFVRNRLSDIKTICNNTSLPIKFKYVHTSQNPADLVTRGLSTATFLDKWHFWLHGPEWLIGEPIVWPEGPLKCLSEASKVLVQDSYVPTAQARPLRAESLFNVEDYSNLHKLLRVAALVFKFINKLRKRSSDPNNEAKQYIIKTMQTEYFNSEIVFLNSDKKGKIPVLVDRLNLFLDDAGIIRSRGRIAKTLYYDYDVLNPILLAKNHHFTTLVINDFHIRCKHLGVQTTLNCLRTAGYWVPKGRQTVKNVISKCILCQKFNCFAFKYPKMTNIPKERMNLIRPFMHTGVDYTGQVFVQEEGSTAQRKMYILVYTCLNIRAIHMDLLPDMSAKSFLMSFLRFCNQYGIPSHLYSDNAKSFVRGGSVLEESLAASCFQENLRANNVKHTRIPLYSAWVGATWERLIRVVKSCLFKTVGRGKLTYFELLTTLSDIQNAVNSRPLTYRSSDNDLEAITPNCFIKLHCYPSLTFRQVDETPLWEESAPSQDTLDRSLSTREEAFQHFRKLWYDSYLLSLREQSHLLYQSSWINRIKVGDIVLVRLPNKSRPFWLMGRILEVLFGADGCARSAKLRRGDGSICHQSINHLYPLELSLTHANNGKYNDSVLNSQGNSESEDGCLTGNTIDVADGAAGRVRPARKAKTRFRQLIQEKLHLLQ